MSSSRTDTKSLSANNKRKRDALDHDAGAGAPPFRRSGSPKTSDLSDPLLSSTGHDDDPMNAEFANALAHHNASPPPALPGPGSHHHNPTHDPTLQHPNGTVDPTTTTNNANGGGPSATDTAAAALSHYQMTVPTSTEQSFLSQNPGHDVGGSFGLGGDHGGAHGLSDYGLDALKTGAGDASGSGLNVKPAVGSDEWHKVRRDNHKEVERRRRETINEGINELAKIVPGCEKNKGSILQRAVSFITQLKENESQNIEKWTLEKLLTEQAIAELSTSVDKLKEEVQRAWNECEGWKRAAKEAGVVGPVDLSVGGGKGEGDA